MTTTDEQHTADLRVTRAGEGEHWFIGGETTTVKLSGADTGGRGVVLETFVRPGDDSGPLHRHRFVETFYVLEGAFAFDTVVSAGRRRTLEATAGDTVHVPPMAWHAFTNTGSGPGRLLVIFSDTVVEELAHAVGQRLDDPTAPPPAPEAPSEEGGRRAGELVAAHEIETLADDAAQGWTPTEQVGR